MAFGQLTEVVNLDSKTDKASKTYYRVLVESEMGMETLLLTHAELVRIRSRVSRNPEDTEMVPSRSDHFASALSRWL